jgi:succinoglycan biosynthesis transport protein ExoP
MDKIPETKFKISRAMMMQNEVVPHLTPSASNNEHAQNEGLLQEYYRTVLRHRWAILGSAVLGVSAGLLLNLNSTPVYRARTSLDIQSINTDFLNMHTVAPTADSGSSSEVYVQTQIKLLQSDELLERTKARVQAEPHAEFFNRTDLSSRLGRVFHVAREGQVPYSELVDYAAMHVTVKPLGITRLVEVTCDSWSAPFSARFCNALVEQFKEDDLENRSREARSTSEWLTRQVADVKAKAEESQKKLEAVTGGNGLILSQESTGVEEARLRELQSEYVKAQADRMQKEAEAGIRSSVSPAMEPDLAQSALYHDGELKLADLRGQIAKLVPPHTEEYPPVVHLRAQIAVIETGLAAERAKNAQHLQSDYSTALHREAMLGAAYRAEESKVSADLGKASRVALLRGEVSSEQQLYQTLSDRAKEAGFASALHASTIRVVDAAKPPLLTSSPRREVTTMSGLLLGGLFGLGFAFIKERNSSVFRVPGEAERVLGLRELGVIPASAMDRKSLARSTRVTQNVLELVPPTEAALPNWGKEDFSIVAEAYRSTTVSILLSDNTPKQGRVYVVSSPNAGEGKTTVSSNLGVALSRSRLRVLLIDGDLRRPSLHKALRVKNDFGLRDLLRDREHGGVESLRAACQPTMEPNLFVMCGGHGAEEIVEMLNSSRISDLVRRLRYEFDVVLIDTPPMLHMADARILATYAQGAILILRAGMTTREEAGKARDLFAQDHVRIIGTILNDFDPKKSGLGSYYSSYYRYQDETPTKKETVSA